MLDPKEYTASKLKLLACHSHPSAEDPSDPSLILFDLYEVSFPEFSQRFILNLLHSFLCNGLDFSVQVFNAL